MTDEQAVLVYLDTRSSADAVHDACDDSGLEEALMKAIEQAGAGEFDGVEFGDAEVVLFMYGPDAEALFSSVEAVLRHHPLCQNARVRIRRGGPDVPAREVRPPQHGTR